MKSGHWRRWQPRIKKRSTVTKPVQETGNVFEVVEGRLMRLPLNRHLWKRKHDLSVLTDYIEEAKHIAYQSNGERKAEDWLYLLALSAPRAAVAQESMDEHPQGYHNKEARLFELIDFNDAYVATILALTPDELMHAVSGIRRLLDTACKKVGTRCFSDEQYEAIVHGLSREIAVYRGLLAEGYEAEMTNRIGDALGIDMRVIDPKTMRLVNVDIKTRSSYHYRIQQLLREGRLDEETYAMADRNGFAIVYNGHDHERTKVVVWRIDHEVVGEVVNFAFEDTKALASVMRVIMLAAGEPV